MLFLILGFRLPLTIFEVFSIFLQIFIPFWIYIRLEPCPLYFIISFFFHKSSNSLFPLAEEALKANNFREKLCQSNSYVILQSIHFTSMVIHQFYLSSLRTQHGYLCYQIWDLPLWSLTYFFIYINYRSDLYFCDARCLEFRLALFIKKMFNKQSSVKIQDQVPSQQKGQYLSEQSRARQKRLQRRLDNSLAVLTMKFISLIKSSHYVTVDLNVVAQALQVSKRRIYDIVNVLEGLDYLEKIQKNIVRWKGGIEKTSVQHEIEYLRKDLKHMEQQQKNLDRSIQNHKIQFQMKFHNDQAKQFHYITHDDIKAINEVDDSEQMIAICFPKGTILQMAQQSNILSLDPARNGVIKVYKCTSNGIRQLLQKKE